MGLTRSMLSSSINLYWASIPCSSKKELKKPGEKLCPNDLPIKPYVFMARRIQVGIQNAWCRNVSIAPPI